MVKIMETIKVLEMIKTQKVVAVIDAQRALDQAIKLLNKYPDFCDVCWTSSWAPVPESTPNAQKIKDKDEYVICQMCEAEKKLCKQYKEENE